MFSIAKIFCFFVFVCFNHSLRYEYMYMYTLIEKYYNHTM